MNKNEALGMFSADGEFIEFTNPASLEGPVEIWLTGIEAAMRAHLKENLKQTRLALRKSLSKRDKWLLIWPGQLCITASQVKIGNT